MRKEILEQIGKALATALNSKSGLKIFAIASILAIALDEDRSEVHNESYQENEPNKITSTANMVVDAE